MKTQYSDIISGYHQHMLGNSAAAKDDFIKILNLEDKEIDVLEYGSGIDAKYFLNKYSNIKNYKGIDNSEEMLDKFREIVNDSRTKIELANIDEFQSKKASYDLVFGMCSIHYTNNLELLMKRVHASLRKGGYFCFRDAHPLVGFFRKKSKRYDVKEIVEFPLAGVVVVLP
ncbi:MAG: class I SAM-dependent methyltransferase [Candidatus Dojkabacteria bacterium]